MGVTACLKMPELVEVDQEVPMGALSIGLVMMPGISSISSSHVVTDDAMGLTYVNTITISVGRIILCRPNLHTTSTGPTIEDITDQEWGAVQTLLLGEQITTHHCMTGHSQNSLLGKWITTHHCMTGQSQYPLLGRQLTTWTFPL